MKTWPIALVVALSACNPSSSRQAPEAPSRPFQPPPGFEEDAPGGTADGWMAQGKALEGERKALEALQAYRRALQTAPSSWPVEKREDLKQRISKISFELGVPGDLSEYEPSAPDKTAETDALRQARAAFTEAEAAEKAGREADAIVGYQKVMGLIQEKDDRDLYWAAWQKAEDLAPQGSSGGAGSLGARLGAMAAEEGVLLPTSRDMESGGDQSLASARASYLKGMEFARTRDNQRAGEEFRKVLSLIEESEDPELYRAASENLKSLGPLPKTASEPD